MSLGEMLLGQMLLGEMSLGEQTPYQLIGQPVFSFAVTSASLLTIME
jgi:hypothetical protein